jgi:hypothetical protein
MEPLQYGWMRSDVVELRQASLIVRLILWDNTTVFIVRMLGLDVPVPHALGEMSDCEEALSFKDVWRSATTMYGAQYVMCSGMKLMLEFSVDSWDCQAQVCYFVLHAGGNISHTTKMIMKLLMQSLSIY